MVNYSIYGLFDLSEASEYKNIRYIGQTVQLPSARVQGHKRSAKDGDLHIHRWIRCIGPDNLGVTVLESGKFLSNAHLDEREIFHISEGYKAGLSLTNLTLGGLGARGYKWPEELVERRSGDGNSFYGRTHTDDVRQKLGQMSKKRWTDEEYLKKQRENFASRQGILKSWEGGESHPFWGRQHKESTKKLISEAGKKQWEDPTPEMQERARQAGLKSAHTRWHKNRGKVDPSCSYCTVI